MRLDELAALSREAARDLAKRGVRPLPCAVLLPRPEASRIVTLPDFPDDDDARGEVLARFADEQMRPYGVPCFGFVAEAVLATPDGDVDVALVAYGARSQGARVSAAPLHDAEVGDFVADEPLDPVALPFLAPLQAAADAAGPPDVTAVR